LTNDWYHLFFCFGYNIILNNISKVLRGDFSSFDAEPENVSEFLRKPQESLTRELPRGSRCVCERAALAWQ
jgi:hypothetical protein